MGFFNKMYHRTCGSSSSSDRERRNSVSTASRIRSVLRDAGRRFLKWVLRADAEPWNDFTRKMMVCGSLPFAGGFSYMALKQHHSNTLPSRRQGPQPEVRSIPGHLIKQATQQKRGDAQQERQHEENRREKDQPNDDNQTYNLAAEDDDDFPVNEDDDTELSKLAADFELKLSLNRNEAANNDHANHNDDDDDKDDDDADLSKLAVDFDLKLQLNRDEPGNIDDDEIEGRNDDDDDDDDDEPDNIDEQEEKEDDYDDDTDYEGDDDDNEAEQEDGHDEEDVYIVFHQRVLVPHQIENWRQILRAIYGRGDPRVIPEEMLGGELGPQGGSGVRGSKRRSRNTLYGKKENP